MNVTSNAQWIKKLPPFLYKLGAQVWIDYEYPRHLFVETNASCNLRCNYCPRERRGEEMEFSLFKRIIDEASHYGSRSFSHHLFGEPLLYSKWFEAIRYVKSKLSTNTVLLTTNGTKINKEIDRLIAANPDLVLWSWRPEAKFTQETKEKLRQWGKFRVRFIKEVTPPEAYEEWKDWPNVEGRLLHNYGGQINTAQWNSRSKILLPQNRWPYYHLDTERFLGMNVSMNDGIQSTSTKSSFSIQNLKRDERWPCYHLWLAPAVAWNGDILICCADPHHKEVVGQFPQMTVAQAWKSEKLTQIRNSHLSGGYGGICAGCDVWKQYPDLFFKWQKNTGTEKI